MKTEEHPEKPKRAIGADRAILYILLALVVSLFGGFLWSLRWTPTHKIESDHYLALSAASEEDTREALAKAETLYRAYVDFWGIDEAPRRKHLLKIYASRAEFKRHNPTPAWAEALYQKPYCHQYIERDNGRRPYQWMIHEATHQLNFELSGFQLPQWAEEGFACYFSTSRLTGDRLELGAIDRRVYPIWWLDSLELSGDLAQDIADRKIMSIKSIVNDEKPLNINTRFNLYYIQWFTLVHFLLEGRDGEYKEAFLNTLRQNSGQIDFEKDIAPFKEIERQWYQHLRKMIASL